MDPKKKRTRRVHTRKFKAERGTLVRDGGRSVPQVARASVEAMSPSGVARLLIRLGFVAAYLYTFPYFDNLRSANEVPRVFLTEEIVDHHTLRLDARWSELSQGSTVDVSTTPGDHRYSNKAPGASLAAIPAYLLLKGWHTVAGGAPTLREATWAFRFSAAALPTLLFLPLFFGLARRFADADAPCRAALVAYALGSMIFPYALLFVSHDLSAACAGGSFVAAVALARGTAQRPRLAALTAGALSGGAILSEYQSAIAATAVFAYLLFRSPRRARDLPLAALGALPPVAALALYHWLCFGSVMRTGYSFAVDSAHKEGFLGVIGPNAQALGQLLVAPDNGLLVFMPWVLLAVVGGIAVARDRQARARVGPETLACALVVAANLLFVGSLVPEFGRAGWSVGPRYIIGALPFFGWLAAAGIAVADRTVVWRTLAHALILVGVVVFVVAATTYPHWPNAFRNPLYEVSLRLLAEGRVPRSLGTALGLRGMASLVPLYALIAALVVGLLAGRDRARLATTAVAALIAAAVVLCYAEFPRKTMPPEMWQFIVAGWAR
ncbi:MAG: hypothetical protein WBP56_02230 [Polyangia bacterium]